jgi:hypothetical protein
MSITLELAAVDVEPWERQPLETQSQWDAFLVYRELGTNRSVSAAFRARSGRKGVAPGRWRAWAQENHWVERAAAWDRELDRLARRAQVDAIRQMRDRQANAGVSLQARSLAALIRILPREADLDDTALAKLLERVSASELLRALELGTKTERLARGEPTEVTDTTLRATVRPMSDEEARAYAGLD